MCVHTHLSNRLPTEPQHNHRQDHAPYNNNLIDCISLLRHAHDAIGDPEEGDDVEDLPVGAFEGAALVEEVGEGGLACI